MNRELLSYYCKDCGTKIHWMTALYSIGKCRSCVHKGKHPSKETRLKMSEALKGNTYSLGIRHSKETIAKMSKALIGNKRSLGKKRSKETCLKISKANTGKHRSEEACINISKAKKGENNPSYIDGTARSPYCREFNEILKFRIRQRDNHVCQICNNDDKRLNRNLCIHHIDYNKEKCKDTNLITLCTSCHTKTNGTKEFDRSYWFAYCTYLMENRKC